MKYYGWCVMAALMMVVATGCGKSGKVADAGEVVAKANQLLAKGDADGGIRVLTDALDQPKYASQRGMLFDELIKAMLGAGRAGQAETQCLEVARNEPTLGGRGADAIYNAYKAKGDSKSAVKWAERLVSEPIDTGLREKACGWFFAETLAAGDLAAVRDMAVRCLKAFDAAVSRRLLGGVLANETGSKRFKEAGELLEAIETHGGADREWKAFAALKRVDLLVTSEQWPELEKEIARVSSFLGNDELARCLGQGVGGAVRKAQFDLADRLCQQVFETVKDKPGARRVAAEQWLASARGRKATDNIPVRLEALIAHGFSSETLYPLCRESFYPVLESEQKTAIAGMVRVAEKLQGMAKDESVRNDWKLLLLDGSFVTEDYDTSLKVLESGIPDRDADWHAMATAKITAHKLLKEGKGREAVGYFRKFMDYIGKNDKPEQDPVTGIMYSTSMCLGRNALRIGRILEAAGEKAEAAKSYEEARGYLQKALAAEKADSAEAGVIRKEMEQLPR